MSTYELIMSELEAWPKAEGVKIGDLMQLSDPLRSAPNNLMRGGSITLEAMQIELGLDREHTMKVVDTLLDRGFIRMVENEAGTGVEYKMWHASAHKREKPLTTWTVILEDIDVMKELEKLQQAKKDDGA